MNLARPDRRQRLERLAAEYALGTSPPRVRRRLAAIAARDRTVAAALMQWEQRLAVLAAEMPAVTPSPRVWTRVSTRLGLEALPAAAPAPARWWTRIGVWRGLAVASFVAAVALGLSQLARPPSPATAPMVVVLVDANARPALIATASRDDRFLTVKPIANTAPAAGRSFELWALPQGGTPKSLGVIPPGAIARIPLPAPAGEALVQIPSLAVSLEPPGGSPTGQPTGPVLYSGSIERMF